MTTVQPNHAEFETLGHRCRLAGASPALERWLRNCWEFGGAPATVATIDVVAATTPPWESVPPHVGLEATALDGTSIIWLRHGERWWSTGSQEAGVDLTLFDERASISVWSRSRQLPRPTLLALHVAMCEALRARGFVPLHAAVIARDGRATALVGRSGIGKSTTVLSALDSGWLPMAEDFAWLDSATRLVHGWGGERGIRLTEDGFRRLPSHWQAASWRADSDGKLVLGYDAMRAPRAPAAELTRVVLLDRRALHDSRLEPLVPREATRALWESAGVPLCRLNRAAFATHAPRLLADLEWTRLVLGRGPLPI